MEGTKHFVLECEMFELGRCHFLDRVREFWAKQSVASSYLASDYLGIIAWALLPFFLSRLPILTKRMSR